MWRLAILVLAAASILYAADSGESLFRNHCAPCHGADGTGGRGPNLTAARLLRAPDDAALSAVITLGIPGTQMPGTRMTAEENRELVAYVRGLHRAQTGRVEGNRENGERLFRGKGNCVQCHTASGRGGQLGPDLSDIGTKRGPEFLRTALLDPEKAVTDTFTSYRRVIFMPDNFLQVHVVTKDGAQIAGTRVNEDSFTIQVRDFGGRLHSFRKDELRELQKDWGKSPMPSYRGVFSDAELADVVAYLVSLQGAQ